MSYIPSAIQHDQVSGDDRETVRARQNPELAVAGLSLVGLAFDYEGNLIVADVSSVYRVKLGVMGKPLP